LPDIDAQQCKCLERIGHQPFTAGLVNRRGHSIDYEAVQPTLPKRNCSGQTGGATPDNESVSTGITQGNLLFLPAKRISLDGRGPGHRARPRLTNAMHPR
jgi:hypothetical protein